MTTPSLRACAITGAVVAAVSTMASTVSAQTAPVLAPGVEKANDFKTTSTPYVVTNTTPLYRTPYYDPTKETGETLKRGEHPQILGEAYMGSSLLVGRAGKGVGYVPRGRVCPTSLCPKVEPETL